MVKFIVNNYKKYIFVFFIVYLLIFTVFYSETTKPKGDEVHYLIATESIVRDNDIYLENNYPDGVTSMFGYLKLDKHTVIGRGNHEILGHGLTIFPFIIAPFYFAAGKLGASLFFCLITVILFQQTIKFSELVTNSHLTSWVVCPGLFLTLPLSQYSLLLFPEVIAGLLIVYNLCEVITKNKLGILSAILIGLLPWIHFRFLTVSIFFLLFWFSRQFKKITKQFFLPLILIFVYFLSIFLIYGSFDFNKTFMNSGSAYSGNIISNIINLLIDRQYGLIPNNPIFLLVLPGFYFLFRSNKKKALLIIALIFFEIMPFINSNDWHGGFAPPGRYLTAVVPIIIPLIVLSITKSRYFLTKTIFLLGFMWGYFVYIINLLQSPNYGYLYKDGFTPYLNKISIWSNLYFYYLFPSYFPDGKITVPHWIWFCTILIISYLVFKKGGKVKTKA